MDDLTCIKGIGRKTADGLSMIGIRTIAHLAAVDAERAERYDIKASWIAEAAKLVAASNEIPAGSPAGENRQPDTAEASASVSAGPPSGAGPEGAMPVAGSEPGAVASAPELSSQMDSERRRFPVNWALMHDGRLVEDGGKVELTLVEHQKLAGGVVSTPWLDGETVV